MIAVVDIGHLPLNSPLFKSVLVKTTFTNEFKIYIYRFITFITIIDLLILIVDTDFKADVLLSALFTIVGGNSHLFAIFIP